MTNAEAIEILKKMGKIGPYEQYEAICIGISALEKQAGPVVFCDKCEHWDRDWNPYGSDGNQHYCPMIDLVTDAGFFCKDGERKGDDDDG